MISFQSISHLVRAEGRVTAADGQLIHAAEEAGLSRLRTVKLLLATQPLLDELLSAAVDVTLDPQAVLLPTGNNHREQPQGTNT